MGELKIERANTHVVDILGNVKGRDQPIMLMDKALMFLSKLDGNHFVNDEIVFFNPFCKAGEIMLSCAFSSCIHKSESKKKIMDIKEVQNELYKSNRYFALSPDERHHKISLRTFLGNENSHIDEYTHIIRNGNYLSEIDGKLNKEKFKMEFSSMINYIKKQTGKNKIIAIGNPPYQQHDGGAKASAAPIYNFFIETMIDSKEIDEFLLVVPARWFSGGKNLKEFRERMINSGEIKALTYFERAEDVFPTVHVQGGVCFLNWKKDHKSDTDFIYKDQIYKTDLKAFDIIPDDPKAATIINKILDKWEGRYIGDVAWSRKAFGMATNYFSSNEEVKASVKNSIKCYVKGQKVKYIKRENVPKKEEEIDTWKVAIPKAYATGARRCTLPANKIFLIEKGAVCTETYNIIDSFRTKSEAEKLIQFLQTDFSRYLLGVRKLTQDIPRDKWNWVPYVDLKKNWTNTKLYNYFGLSKDEVKHIEKKLKEWS